MGFPNGVIMRILDRFLQRWRMQEASGWVPNGSRVLDIGCHQGEFLDFLAGRIDSSVGMDPLAKPRAGKGFRIITEVFREPLPFADRSFDAVVLLATLEHIPDKTVLARECWRMLRPGGRLIITVPAPVVDRIVERLVRLRVADGMSMDEHHGFEPRETLNIFPPLGFLLEYRKRFQLGVNYLFVFRRGSDQGGKAGG
jgi:SAM-dependent methyltransferase